MADNEERTYQPRWEEKKAEQEQHHHHHHHHYYEHSYGKQSKKSIDFAGWLKNKDKQAWIGLLVILIAAVGFGLYKLYGVYREDFKALYPEGNDEVADKVDALNIDKVAEADKLLFADSLKTELQMDSLVRTVTGEHHNVYRPPKKNDNVTIDGREWNSIFKNLRRWFKANGGDPKLIIALVLFGLFIIGLAGYGIYKHKHRHGNYRW